MINFDTVNFTPTYSFIGGLLIGIAVVIFFVSNGRLAGVSGIVNNALTKHHNRTINLLFLFGLILGPLFYFVSPEWCVLFGGFFAGTIAYFIGEKNDK